MTKDQIHIIFDFDLTLVPEESLVALLKLAFQGQGNETTLLAALNRLQQKSADSRLGLRDMATAIGLFSKIQRSHVTSYIQSRIHTLSPELHILLKRIREDGHILHVLSHGYHDYVAPLAFHWGFDVANVTASNHFFWFGRHACPLTRAHLLGPPSKSQIIRNWRRMGRLDGNAIMIGDAAEDCQTYQDGLVQGFICADYYTDRPRPMLLSGALRAERPSLIYDLLGSIMDGFL